VLEKDLSDSKNLLEDIIGEPVFGYRTPSFCITHDVLKTIQDCGYLYDSSFNSFNLHNRYGHLDLSQNGKKGIAIRIDETRSPSVEGQMQKSQAPSSPFSIQYPVSSIQVRTSSIQYLASSGFFELPISNLQIGNSVLPWGGGVYFRLIPLPLFRIGVQSILNKDSAYLFYMHPWEIDEAQPRVKNAPRFLKFRHYANLDKTASRLSSFIKDFKSHGFVTCHEYLEQHVKKHD
jgi:hypothetical protein